MVARPDPTWGQNESFRDLLEACCKSRDSSKLPQPNRCAVLSCPLFSSVGACGAQLPVSSPEADVLSAEQQLGLVPAYSGLH